MGGFMYWDDHALTQDQVEYYRKDWCLHAYEDWVGRDNYNSNAEIELEANCVAYLDDGCEYEKTTPDDHQGRYVALTEQHFFRCCGGDGTCMTPKPCPLKTTFADAAKQCSELGHRLCTWEELQQTDECCYTGCGFDSRLVWTSKLSERSSRRLGVFLE